MNKLLLLVIPLFTLLIVSCSKNPDVIYYNGKIYTLDENNAVIEAIAVKDGKIFETGKSVDLNSKYDGIEKIDLNGRTVIPGLIDSEGSIIEFSRNLNFLDLSQAKSISEIKKLLSERLKNMNPDSWVGGFGWNELMLSEDDLINMDKNILDEIAPDVNVYLVNITSSAVWCNTKLLKTLQITELTPSPEGGEIEKDAEGKLTGLFYDNAVNLVKEKIPVLTKEDIMKSVEKGANELLKYGITGIRDKTVTLESISIIKELIDNDKFNNRINAVISAGDDAFEHYINKGIEVDYGDRLTVRCVSIDFDGSINLHAAYLSEKYLSKPDTANLYTSIENIESLFAKSVAKGLQFSVKTVGDKAVSENLEIIGKIINEKGLENHRTIFEYVQFIRPEDLTTFSKYKIIPSIRPEIDINSLTSADSLLSDSSRKYMANWNDILSGAGIITAGSNFPFNTINPIIQIYYLVTRKNFNADSLSRSSRQKLTVLDAVKSYTKWAAYSGFEENMKGSIEVSKYADFVVLSDDIFNHDVNNLYEIKILKTVFSGKILYDSERNNMNN